jgi:hypothetical protein
VPAAIRDDGGMRACRSSFGVVIAILIGMIPVALALYLATRAISEGWHSRSAAICPESKETWRNDITRLPPTAAIGRFLMRSILCATALAFVANTANAAVAESSKDVSWQQMATYLLKTGGEFQVLPDGWIISTTRPGRVFWMHQFDGSMGPRKRTTCLAMFAPGTCVGTQTKCTNFDSGEATITTATQETCDRIYQ